MTARRNARYRHETSAPSASRITYDLDRWAAERWTRDTRYYDIHTHQNLWGDWVVTRVNGRAGEALGRVVHEVAGNRSAALIVVGRLARRRRQRGYGREAVPEQAAELEESVKA